MIFHHFIFETKAQGDELVAAYEQGAAQLGTLLGRIPGNDEYVVTFGTARALNKEQQRKLDVYLQRFSGLVEYSLNVGVE